MTSRKLSVLIGLWLACASAHTRAQAPPALTVVQSGPNGEVASLQEANEVRIVFSEPMVSLGRIPDPVTAPFVTIRPAIAGTFRWSGTTILIFTPDPSRRLPNATRYDVTVDTTAAAVSGRRLATPYQFSFTTPTVKLMRLDWYRKNKRYDGIMVLALRFNQSVRAADLLPHVRLAFVPHPFEEPKLSDDGQARLRANDPQAIPRFQAKVAAASAAASASTSLRFAPATAWDIERFPRST